MTHHLLSTNASPEAPPGGVAGDAPAVVRLLETGAFAEGYVTAFAPAGMPAAPAARRLFTRVVSVLASRSLQPIQEKIYGLASARDEVLAARRAVLEQHGLDADLPCSYHEGRPVDGGELAGLQLWGVRPGDGSGMDVTTVAAPVGPAGRCWSGDGFRQLYLPGIRGLAAGQQPAVSVTEQAERMLESAGAALRAHGMSFTAVARTWIYLARILDWYGEFNRVRTGFFAARRIAEHGSAFPASTGIQGRTGGEECSMDLLAVEGSAHAEPLLRSRRQDRAFDYGSAFSRAMSVAVGGREAVYVSGTASIDPQGRSVHLDEPEAQIIETLLSISALLEQRGAGLGDITLATVFCKHRRVACAYRELVELLGLPAFPAILVLADICRPELQVEIEAVAIVPARGRAAREVQP